MYYVYAVVSKVRNRIYVGFSKNLELRIKEHNSGKTKSTKHYKPWVLFYSEKFETRIAARQREIELKSGFGREFLRRLLSNAPVAQLDRAPAF